MDGKIAMKQSCSREWGLQDQALHDQYNPGHRADTASLIYKSNPISIQGTIHMSKDGGNGPLRSNYHHSYVSSLT